MHCDAPFCLEKKILVKTQAMGADGFSASYK